MGTASSAARLSWGLRQALEDWLGETIRTDSPYEDLIDELAKAIDAGDLTLGRAARLGALLRATTGKEDAECGICACPIPGASHPISGGCPDLRLHDPKHSPDGKCRYCR